MNQSNNKKPDSPHVPPVPVHPRFRITGSRVAVRGVPPAPEVFSVHVHEITHCVEIDDLARSDPQKAVEMAHLSLLYTPIANAFNIDSKKFKFVHISSDGSIRIDGRAVSLSNFGITPNMVAPNRNTSVEEKEVMDFLLRRHVAGQVRKQQRSISNRQRKKEKSERSYAASKGKGKTTNLTEANLIIIADDKSDAASVVSIPDPSHLFTLPSTSVPHVSNIAGPSTVTTTPTFDIGTDLDFSQFETTESGFTSTDASMDFELLDDDAAHQDEGIADVDATTAAQ